MFGEFNLAKFILNIIISIAIFSFLQCIFFPKFSFVDGFVVEKDGVNNSYGFMDIQNIEELSKDADGFHLRYFKDCTEMCCEINQFLVDRNWSQDRCID